MTTYTDLRNRLAASLADDSSLTFTEAIYQEAIRRALERIGYVYALKLAIAGLDSAATTTLPDKDIPCLLSGAAGLALTAILHIRFTTFTPSLMEDVALRMRTDKLLEEFNNMLDALRVETMQVAEEPPHSALEWDESYFHDPEVEY